MFIGIDTNKNLFIINRESADTIFENNGSERARIDSSGRFLVGTTSAVNNELFNVTGGVTDVYQSRFRNTNTSPYGLSIQYTAAAPNGTLNQFIGCGDSSVDRFIVRSNGGIANYSANNVNLSDRREKTNFAPAGSYLDKICAIPVQTFNYIDQNMEEDAGLTLGVVAQDVQAVAPELVTESNWGTLEEPKIRLSIYQTDLQYALMKCIQEQQSIIQSLTARLGGTAFNWISASSILKLQSEWYRRNVMQTNTGVTFRPGLDTNVSVRIPFPSIFGFKLDVNVSGVLGVVEQYRSPVLDITEETLRKPLS